MEARETAPLSNHSKFHRRSGKQRGTPICQRLLALPSTKSEPGGSQNTGELD